MDYFCLVEILHSRLLLNRSPPFPFLFFALARVARCRLLRAAEAARLRGAVAESAEVVAVVAVKTVVHEHLELRWFGGRGKETYDPLATAGAAIPAA